MKLIIDVSEKLVCEGFERPFTEEEKNILIKAIGNGIPLDDVKAEIEQLRNFRAEDYDLEQYCDYFDARIIFRDDALQIIDKYIGKGGV